MSFFPIYKKSYFLNACLRGAVGLALLGSSLPVESNNSDFLSAASGNDIKAPDDIALWYAGTIAGTGNDEKGKYFLLAPYRMRDIALQGVGPGDVKNIQLAAKSGFWICCDSEGRSVPVSITNQAPLDSKTLKMHYTTDAESEKMIEDMKVEGNKVTFMSIPSDESDRSSSQARTHRMLNAKLDRPVSLTFSPQVGESCYSFEVPDGEVFPNGAGMYISEKLDRLYKEFGQNVDGACSLNCEDERGKFQIQGRMSLKHDKKRKIGIGTFTKESGPEVLPTTKVNSFNFVPDKPRTSASLKKSKDD